nr:hypothetical protein [Tanacetum cinerariifolium]
MLSAVQVINVVEQHIQLRRAFNGRQVAILLGGKRRHTHGIALTQRDITQQQAGIEGVIEMRQLAILAAHPASAVEQEN